MSELAAVFFDMDGTVVETESLWYESEIRTMQHFGTDWTAHDQEVSLGGPFDRVAQYMAAKARVDPADTARTLSSEIEHLMRTRALNILPGVRELHAQLRTAGFPVALVSNSWRILIDIVIEETGLQFDVTVGSDEVLIPKPDPAPYLHAAERLGVDPGNCVVLEDSATGIASATAAGCFVVAVPQVSIVEPAPRRMIVRSLAGVHLDTLRDFVASGGTSNKLPPPQLSSDT